MVKNGISIIKKYKTFFSLCLIFFVIILAYGLTLQMYFWKDDFALMIKARYPMQSVGYFAEGYRGGVAGGYSYIPLLFEAFFPLFGMYAMPYFLVGIFFYFGAAIAVYYLGLAILKNRIQALCSALIFAAGYVGADSIFGLTNSYQTSWVIILTCLILLFLLKYYEQKKIIYYLLSFGLFILCLITGYVRAHGIIIGIVALGLLLIKNFRIKEIGKFVLLLLPYFYFFNKVYLSSGAGGTNRSRFLSDILQGNYTFFTKTIATLAGVFFPYTLIQSLATFWTNILQKPFDVESINIVLGSLLLLVTCFFLWRIKDTNKKKVLLFSLLFIIGNYIAVFYIGAASSSLISTHRYLTIPLVGAGLYLVTLFSLIKHKKVFYGFIASVVFVNCFFSNLYSVESITMRTNPQKKFFTQIQEYLPTIQKGTILYYDVSDQYQSPGKFGNIFGVGMAGGSPEISSHYDIDRYDITSFYSYPDFIRGIYDGKTLKDVYSFYYENENLINTTELTRKLLRQKTSTDLSTENYTITSQKSKEQPETWDEQSFELPIKKVIPTVTDNMLHFTLTINPLSLTESDFLSTNITDNSSYFSYLQERKQIKAMTKATVGSFYQHQIAENLLDDNDETTWMGARGVWGAIVDKTTKYKEFVELSLPSSMDIGGILFTAGSATRSPRKYVIYAFIDGNWKMVKNVTGPARNTNELFFEPISSQVTDKIRIEFQQTTGNDSPQLAEIELVPIQYARLDFAKAFSLAKNPLMAINSLSDYQTLLNTYSTFAYFTVSYYSDKDKSYVVTPIPVAIKGLYSPFTYDVILPAGGIQLKSIKISNLSLPAQYTFSDFRIENVPLSEEKMLYQKMVE